MQHIVDSLLPSGAKSYHFEIYQVIQRNNESKLGQYLLLL